ncbi:MAG TPA: hypothetical protein VK801_04080 [Caulobacteraceae bacterium]|jgi:hypothetical protein|nr:hypothetical protein [Caulobacteraceae bacterium]
MHIHRPKAAQSLRDFAAEIGVIVAGILIALALEQSVQFFHEQQIAAEAREAVRAEVRENLWWMQRRGMTEPCVRRRLSELGVILGRARTGASIPVIYRLGLLAHAKITSLRWEANSQAGRASLFTGDEQRMLGNMYYTTEQFHQAQSNEEIVWSKLRAIQGLDRLTPLEVHDFSVLLAEARYQNWMVVLSLHRAGQWAGRMHLAPQNPTNVEGLAPSVRTQICQPITAPVAASAGTGVDGVQPEDIP